MTPRITNIRWPSRLALALASSLMLALPTRAGAVPEQVVYLETDGEPVTQLPVELGKATVVRPGFQVKRVSVGNPEIADVIVTSPNELSVVAKSTGETNVVLWDQSGRPHSLLDVQVGRPKSRLEGLIAKHLPGEEIHVDSSNGSIVLSGTVSSTQAMENALQLASTMVASEQKGSGDGHSAHATENGDGTGDKVVNLMRVSGQHQVMIDIAVAEMSRTLGRRIGTNFAATIGDSATNVKFFSFLNGITSLSETGDVLLTDRANLVGSVFDDGDGSASVFLELLENEGLTKILAEPTVVARSGETANFLVGGEIPIPVAQGGAFGSISVVFKSFGISVQFTPTVLSPDQIHLQIAPEVSEPDFTLATLVEGTLVPAFTTRRASTGVDIRDGESFAIAGLLSDNIAESVEKYPILGDIPVLGALFRSSQFKHDETELVLVVTPHLVAPLGAKPPLPTDHMVPPSAAEFYLLGRLEGSGDKFSSSTPASGAEMVGPAGYRVTPTDAFGGNQ